jgi:hypothetical protein
MGKVKPESLFADRDKYQHFEVSKLFGAAGESLLHYSTEWENINRIGKTKSPIGNHSEVHLLVKG